MARSRRWGAIVCGSFGVALLVVMMLAMLPSLGTAGCANDNCNTGCHMLSNFKCTQPDSKYCSTSTKGCEDCTCKQIDSTTCKCRA